MRGFLGRVDAGTEVGDPHLQPADLVAARVELRGHTAERTVAGSQLRELVRESVAVGAGVGELLLRRGEPDHLVFGAVPSVVGGAQQAALGQRSGCLGPVELGVKLGPQLLLFAQPVDVLVEQAVVLRQRAPQHAHLVHDAVVLFVEPLQLVGDLGSGGTLGLAPLPGAALGLLLTQPFDLAPQRGRVVLSLRPRVVLLLETLVFVGQDPAGLLGRPVVAPSRVLELGQPLAHGPAAGVGRLRHCDRVDAQRRRRRRGHLGALPFGEKLVQEQSRSPRAVRRLGDGVRRPVNT